jgi:DNA repair exonuclease SbcCD ATPase subunit
MNPLLENQSKRNMFGEFKNMVNNTKRNENTHRQTYKSNSSLYQQKLRYEKEENKKARNKVNVELKILKEQLSQLEKEFNINKSKIEDSLNELNKEFNMNKSKIEEPIKELEEALSEINNEEEKLIEKYKKLQVQSKSGMNRAIKQSRQKYWSKVNELRTQELNPIGLQNSYPKVNRLQSQTPKTLRKHPPLPKPRGQTHRSGISL